MKYVPKYSGGKPLGTLCWYCTNAVPNPEKKTGCSWSKEFQPVEGWEAISLDVATHKASGTATYCVCKCPQFQDEQMRIFDNYMDFYSRLVYEEGELVGGESA